MGGGGKCISPANPATMQTDESRKQKRNNSAARGRINSFNKRSYIMTDRIRKLHIPGIMRNYKSYCGIFTRSSIRIKGLHFIFFSSGLRISSEKYPSERFYPALTTLSSDAKLHGSSSGSISWTGCAGNFPAVKSSMVRKTRSAISSTGWRSET